MEKTSELENPFLSYRLYRKAKKEQKLSYGAVIVISVSSKVHMRLAERRSSFGSQRRYRAYPKDSKDSTERRQAKRRQVSMKAVKIKELRNSLFTSMSSTDCL